MKLIGISGKKLSGKDALCNAIIGQTPVSAVRIAFADALKEEVSLACSVSLSFIDQYKAQFRPMLQWWGTDFRRHFQGDDYWVRKAVSKLVEAADAGVGLVIIPDVRFQSEAAVIKQIGGCLVRIGRPTQLIDDHPSEIDLDNYKGFDHLVINNGTLKDLDHEAVVILKQQHIQTK